MFNAILFLLFLNHIYWLSFRIFFHSGAAHKHWTLDPKLEHVFRFCLWLTNSLSFPNWVQHLVAQHQAHHVHSDTENDLISPHVFSLKQLLTCKKVVPGGPFYVKPDDLIQYGSDIKSYDDWIERNLYQKYRNLGLNILWIIYTLLFGIPGFFVGAFHRFFIIQFNIWISLYLYHKVGYSDKNYQGTNKAKNLFPIGILLAGEELHFNHHVNPARQNFAIRWYEFDIGYWYARLFRLLGLIKFK
jgi:stearoyl-CoA desaturase (delta-9 desaturase)